MRTINEHLRNLYEEGELDPARTIRNYRIVRREGVREVAREIDHYNLDAILSMGYRVRSERGTQFRRRALLEAETERDQQQTLEAAAKRLPQKTETRDSASMKLHFEPNLDYQLAAVDSVSGLSRGQEVCLSRVHRHPAGMSTAAANYGGHIHD